MNWDAIGVALAQHAQPGRVEELRARALPPGMTELLRAALGQDDVVAAAAAGHQASRAQIVDAARFFIEQQVLARVFETDPWRQLGLAPTADEDTIKTHHRLLVRLVHPDRSDDWADAYADRVNRAWRQLRHGDHRHAAGLAPNGPADVWEERPASQRLAATPIIEAAAVQGGRRSRTGVVIGVTALAAVTGSIVALWGEPVGTPINTTNVPLAVATEEKTPWYADAPTEWTDATIATAPPLDELVPIESISTVGTDPVEASRTTTLPTSSTPRATSTTPARETSRRAPAPAPAEIAVDIAPSSEAAMATARRSPARVAVSPPAMAIEPTPIVNTDASVPSEIDRAEASAVQTLDAIAGQALLRDFRARYAEGDLGGLLGLYAREVHAEHRQVGRIANEYARLFKSSQQRYIDFSDVQWQQRGNRLLGTGRYETGFRKLSTLRKHVERGRVEFELVLEGETSRLRRFERHEGARS